MQYKSPKTCAIRFLIFSVFLSTTLHAQLVVSEVMADPSGVTDTQGEFLELANVGKDSIRLDSLALEVDGGRFVLAHLELAAGGLYTICRDSLPAENGGIECDCRLPALALANGRPLTIAINQSGQREVFSMPGSQPGTSWENTLDVSADYRRFLPSMGTRPNGDKATPGSRNSRSVEPARLDLGITGVTPASDGSLTAEIQDLGSLESATAALALWLDRDWDGEFETFLDSISIRVGAGATGKFSLPVGRGEAGLLRAVLSRDENPLNDEFFLPLEAGKPFVLTELCPAPEANAPEWLEIRNGTGDYSGQARWLSLRGLNLNGIPLGEKAGGLNPGEFLVVTESAEQFRNQYGEIKVRLLELTPWPGLRNTADTLQLSFNGLVLDSMVYNAEVLNGELGCLMPGPKGLRSGEGSPGYSEPFIEEFAWTVTGRQAGNGRALAIEVRAPAGTHFTLGVFDLEGNRIDVLEKKGVGRRVYLWSGQNAHGQALAAGAYILALAAEGHKTRRCAIAVSGH